MPNIHAVVLRRLLLAWLLISGVVGAALYYIESENIDDQVVALARQEAEQFAAQSLALLAQPDPAALSRLEQRVQELASRHFAVVEIYDRQRHKLVEVTPAQYATLERELSRQPHHFPVREAFYYEKFRIGGETVVQVLVPIRDGEGRLGGFFEGVYVVDPATLAHLQEDMLRTLVAVLALVLLTTLIFYPLIVALNRDVLRFSREVLRGNLEIVAVLGAAIAKRDSETSAHNYRVTLYAIRLGEALGVDGVAMRGLILGAFLHDVGKIGISDAILLKPGRLDEAEFAAMRRHVALGVDIISATEWLVGAREVVECHHERYDGRGYPCGLAGEAIPLAARIFALADVFDALTSRRPYKEALALDEALAIIARDAGSHFDPMLAQRFAEVVPPLYHELAQAAEEQIVARLRELAMHYFFKAAGLVTPACGGPGGERPASLMARVAAALADAAPGGRLPAERE